MKLNIGDRIRYEDSIYAVVAVIYTTVYLREVKADSTDYDYEMQEVYKKYRAIEFLGKKKIIWKKLSIQIRILLMQ